MLTRRRSEPLAPLTLAMLAIPEPLAPLTLAMLAFLLIMFTPGIISTFYLILFPADFSDIHPGHNKTT